MTKEQDFLWLNLPWNDRVDIATEFTLKKKKSDIKGLSQLVARLKDTDDEPVALADDFLNTKGWIKALGEHKLASVRKFGCLVVERLLDGIDTQPEATEIIRKLAWHGDTSVITVKAAVCFAACVRTLTQYSEYQSEREYRDENALEFYERGREFVDRSKASTKIRMEAMDLMGYIERLDVFDSVD